MRSDPGLRHAAVLGFAFLVGGLLAAGVTVLCAPEEGSRTRERLRGYLGDAWGRTCNAVGSAADQGRGFVSGTVAPINAAYRAGKDAYRSESSRLRRLTRHAGVDQAAEARLPM